MTIKLSKFTLRISEELLKKFRYIATVSSSYVTGVYFYIYPDQDFYFSLDNVDNTPVKGAFTVSAGL